MVSVKKYFFFGLYLYAIQTYKKKRITVSIMYFKYNAIEFLLCLSYQLDLCPLLYGRAENTRNGTRLLETKTSLSSPNL